MEDDAPPDPEPNVVSSSKVDSEAPEPAAELDPKGAPLPRAAPVADPELDVPPDEVCLEALGLPETDGSLAGEPLDPFRFPEVGTNGFSELETKPCVGNEDDSSDGLVGLDRGKLEGSDFTNADSSALPRASSVESALLPVDSVLRSTL